jgi:Family of unknown function (DUF6600)
MKPLRLATIAFLLGSVTTCVVYGQPPGYGGPPGSQPSSAYDRGYDGASTPRGEVGFFYDELSPYGDWVLTNDYGWAWFPRDVPPYWRPYTDGRWVTTEYGWTWVSNEPFGWATYHYGRWAWDSRIGWLWVPGTVWGPAWVSWESGGGYVGWAPLPPAVGFEIGIGIRLGGFDLNIGIQPSAYSFVPERSFLEPRVSGYLIPTARNVTIIHTTTNITNYTYVNNRVVNRGVEVRRIEQATGRRVRPLRVTEAKRETRSEMTASEVRIYRPAPQKLESIRVGPRANTGPRAEARPTAGDREQPVAAPRAAAPEFKVAPRVGRVPPPDTRQLDQQKRREQQQLEQYQMQEKRKLEKLQGQEIAKTRAQAERAQVEKSHQAELEALKQEQRNAAQQLAARQEARRQAAMATPPPGRANPQGEQKAPGQQLEKKKAKNQQQQKKKDTSRVQDEKPQAPPPA